MAEDDDQEKTEPATQKKREEAKRNGQVARSQDVIHAASLCAFLLGIYLFGGALYGDLVSVLEEFLRYRIDQPLTREGAADFVANLLFRVMAITGPLVAFLSLSLILANTLQTGVAWNVERLSINWNRINPLEGYKKLFSLRGLATMGSSILKISAILWVMIYTVKSKLPEVATLGETSLENGLSSGWEILLLMIFRVALLLIVIAAIDFSYQKWQHEKDLRMSKEEIRQEAKRSEGDPKTKGRIRKIQREVATRRMLEDVSTADVVVTNPHRLAVAIRYDRGQDAAPVVVAKGMNLIAQRIRHEARKHGIPLVENKPLAWALYRSVDIGRAIPEKLFHAVAEVLAFVYRLKERRS